MIELFSRKRCHAVRALSVGIAAVVFALVAAVATYASDESDLLERAKRIHRDAIVVDGHNDITTLILDYQFDLGMDGSSPGRRDATLYWVPAPHRSGAEPEFERLQGILSCMLAAMGSRLWRSEDSSRRSPHFGHRIATTFPARWPSFATERANR